MSQLDNSLPDLIEITSLEVTHMHGRSCYNWHLENLHRRFRGHLRDQKLKLVKNESEVHSIDNLI